MGSERLTRLAPQILHALLQCVVQLLGKWVCGISVPCEPLEHRVPQFPAPGFRYPCQSVQDSASVGQSAFVKVLEYPLRNVATLGHLELREPRLLERRDPGQDPVWIPRNGFYESDRCLTVRRATAHVIPALSKTVHRVFEQASNTDWSTRVSRFVRDSLQVSSRSDVRVALLDQRVKEGAEVWEPQVQIPELSGVQALPLNLTTSVGDDRLWMQDRSRVVHQLCVERTVQERQDLVLAVTVDIRSNLRLKLANLVDAVWGCSLLLPTRNDTNRCSSDLSNRVQAECRDLQLLFRTVKTCLSLSQQLSLVRRVCDREFIACHSHDRRPTYL